MLDALNIVSDVRWWPHKIFASKSWTIFSIFIIVSILINNKKIILLLKNFVQISEKPTNEKNQFSQLFLFKFFQNKEF